MIAAFLAKPAVKYGIAAALALGLVIGALLVVNHIYRKGETAGAGKVSGAVMEKTIKDIEAARKEKAETDEKVRNAPIDRVIDGLQ